MRDWLIERDALPEDPLVAMIPMSVRKRDERGAWGNRISMMIVPIPTNEPDPATRLQPHPRVPALRQGAPQRAPRSLLTDATAFIPPTVASLAARNTVDILSRTRPPLNLVISNVPGPRTSLYCAGAEMISNFPVSVIVDGVGLNITVVSYKDRVDFGIVGDREQIDDAWAFLEGAAHALTELEAIGRARTSTKRLVEFCRMSSPALALPAPRVVLADAIPGARVRDATLVLSGALLTVPRRADLDPRAAVAGADHRPDARGRPGGRDSGGAPRRGVALARPCCSACSSRSTATASRALDVIWGASGGYIIGFIGAADFVGRLAERGADRSAARSPSLPSSRGAAPDLHVRPAGLKIATDMSPGAARSTTASRSSSSAGS